MTSKNLRVILIAAVGFVFLCSMSSSINKTIKNPEGFAFIPMGKTTIDGDTVSVQAFFMSKTEVTNKDYREYLFDLKLNGQLEAYQKALPDTLQWRDKLAYNEPFVEFYFRHPAYSDYPVVNISREQAEMYCVWLTKKLREAFGNEINDARLPYREEWVMAARGSNQAAEYSWNTVGKAKQKKGTPSAIRGNYLNIGPESIHFNETTGKYEVMHNNSLGIAGYINDAADITAPVQSYFPNDYGLYNMSGNVAEMVQQNNVAVGGSWHSSGYDVRIESTSAFTGPCTTVGFRPVITYLGK